MTDTDELIETLERRRTKSMAFEREFGLEGRTICPDDLDALFVTLSISEASALISALKENKRMREALTETQVNLELVEQVPIKDPDYGSEVEALGERIGYGALMTSASASWHARLKHDGWPTGGAFVAGPCHATVLKNLEMVRAALQPQGEK